MHTSYSSRRTHEYEDMYSISESAHVCDVWICAAFILNVCEDNHAYENRRNEVPKCKTVLTLKKQTRKGKRIKPWSFRQPKPSLDTCSTTTYRTQRMNFCNFSTDTPTFVGKSCSKNISRVKCTKSSEEKDSASMSMVRSNCRKRAERAKMQDVRKEGKGQILECVGC